MKYLVLLIVLVLFSCVSKKKYAAMELQKASYADKTAKLGEQNEAFLKELSEQEKTIKDLQSQNLELKGLLEEERNQRDNFMVDPQTVGKIPAIGDKQAEFIGGERAMMKWMSKNVRYPQEAKEANIEGKVFVSFSVGIDGSIENVKIARGVHKLLDDEAIRVIKSMPKWIPGTAKGKPVKTRMNVPIAFRLA